MARDRRGWFGDSYRHSLAAKGIKSGRKPEAGMSNRGSVAVAVTLSDIEDFLVLRAEKAKSQEGFEELLKAADDIGDLVESVRIFSVEEGALSGPTGRMVIVDL